ncbi:ABC transporter permease [Methylocaldum sp.]|uniref:ABC transporter permease n=1 Tax=Methylocaldum sp. TaxID=1969727 RepID=UPI002D2BDA10|nr:FtsX-like permease family protein [Methylocaldum sp.]HYE33908.1 FtsX-like permease family protein [Methylocaldum sp.]
MAKNFKLALKLVARDWRSGELTILMVALLIAVASSSAVSLLGDRLVRTMNLQTAEFLAADLVVGGHQEPPDSWRQEASSHGLQAARTTEFSSVLIENDELLLVGVKAVENGYPLRGSLRTTLGGIALATETREIPNRGETWVEQRVLATLGLNLGSKITVGEKPLRVTRILTHEPDRRGDLYSLSARVLMNQADVAETRVIQPGSHVHYYELFAGDERALRAFKRWLKPQLHPGQRILDVHEDRPELGNALNRAERYLGLTSIAVVLISGVAIAMSARRYTERHYDMTAMFKCLGARERDILWIYLSQFLAVGLIASSLGCALGYLAQEGVIHLLRSLLPHTLASPDWHAVMFGAATGLLILFGFALPPILRLRRLAPLRVLRRDLEPLPSSAWVVYGFAALTLSALLWRYTRDWIMTASVLAIGGTAVAVFSLIGLWLLGLGRLLLPYVSLSWRFGLQHLTRHPRLGVSQILAFSITLVAMLVSLLVRTELLQEWKRQLPANTPNHFALNLFDTDLERFREALSQEGIASSEYYPIVRGRLTAINGKDVFAIVHKDSRAESSINRELSLTWASKLPPDNRVVQGKWVDGSGPLTVSVEAELAESLGIDLGDKLTFNIAGQPLAATAIGTRSVRWDTMTPNFFMIFSPGSLDAYPHTWLTSFYVPTDLKPVLGRLTKSFPSMTILEVDALLKQFQMILQQVTHAIEYVLLLALAAGFTVLFAAVRATMDERIHEDVLLRTMGANRRLLRNAQWVEFAALGFLAGILASAISEVISWILFSRVFDLAYRFHWETWLATPVLGALVVGLAGYMNTRSVVKNSPMRVLREL